MKLQTNQFSTADRLVKFCCKLNGFVAARAEKIKFTKRWRGSASKQKSSEVNWSEERVREREREKEKRRGDVEMRFEYIESWAEFGGCEQKGKNKRRDEKDGTKSELNGTKSELVVFSCLNRRKSWKRDCMTIATGGNFCDEFRMAVSGLRNVLLLHDKDVCVEQMHPLQSARWTAFNYHTIILLSDACLSTVQ